MLIGLGNPGKKYSATRHNIGFMAVDRIGSSLGVDFNDKMCRSVVAKGKMGGESVVLAKPQTYMNLSGTAVAALLRRFSLGTEDFAVFHDDIDIPFGKIKEKKTGGSAGHRGIKSIMDELGTRDFHRIRIGVGRPPEGSDCVDYVLRPFDKSEKVPLEIMLDECCSRAINFV
ncbi:MAG: peptidyl-tRNA hydrolase [bacterium]|nr:MAG: peptidyl-tRNA hydrolase [bacterium]